MVLLISDKLVELVERHSDIIVKRWITRISGDPTTSSYTQKNIEYLGAKAKNMLENLGRWVSYDTTKDDVGKRYAGEGIDSFKRQIPLCEVIRGMYTLRRTLWLFVVNESAFDTPIQMHQMRELSDRVILFFDRAEYYLIRGYMEEMNRKIKELWKLKPEDTEKIFFNESFYNQ
jgi:hypothetical protein